MRKFNLNSGRTLDSFLYLNSKSKFFNLNFRLSYKESKEEVNVNKLIHKLKFGSYKIGALLGSVSFGVFLFAMQSYFLRQNLGLTGKAFVSD